MRINIKMQLDKQNMMRALRTGILAPFNLSFLLVLLILSDSCSSEPVSNKTDGVVFDSVFIGLFSPDSGGITGADGVFSIALPDGSSLFLTGDCFLGQVVDGSRDISTKMMNNSIVHVNKEMTEAKAVYRGTYNDPESLFVPLQEGDSKRWYWPGHGFFTDSTLYIFALNMYNDPALVVKSEKDPAEMDVIDKMSENQWSFALAGIDLLRFSYPDLQFLGADSVKHTYESDIHFGNCVFTEGNFIYFYGTRSDPDGSHVYVARTNKAKLPYHENWEFFDGNEWVGDHRLAGPLGIDISVSEQFSIFRIRNRYVLLSHEKMTNDIYTYTSAHPHKGFDNKSFIYSSPEPEADTTHNLFAYNAVAHPQYMKGSDLLVSYCVNSFRVRDVFENADNYRARFIRVPLSMIDPSFTDYQPD